MGKRLLLADGDHRKHKDNPNYFDTFEHEDGIHAPTHIMGTHYTLDELMDILANLVHYLKLVGQNPSDKARVCDSCKRFMRREYAASDVCFGGEECTNGCTCDDVLICRQTEKCQRLPKNICGCEQLREDDGPCSCDPILSREDLNYLDAKGAQKMIYFYAFIQKSCGPKGVTVYYF